MPRAEYTAGRQALEAMEEITMRRPGLGTLHRDPVHLDTVPLGGPLMTVSLITGTSKGIGLTMAVHLAKAGHRVYASMRDTGRADGLLEAAKAAGVEVRVVPLDVRDDTSVRGLWRPSWRRRGRSTCW